MIAVFAGLDGATSRTEAFHLASECDPSGNSTSRLDGRTASVSEIVNQVGALGFFGARRVVIVTDLLSRAKRGARKAESEASEEPAVDIAPIVAATREENLLILLETSTATLPAGVSRALPSTASITISDPPRGQALVNWIQERSKAEGSSIEPDVARLLAARIYPQTWSAVPSNPRYDRPPDMELLGNEVAKLVSAAWPGPVTRATVEEMAINGDTDQIFRFGDAAGQGNLRSAIPELARLLDAGEEPARLSAQLAQQAELGIVIEVGGSRSASTIARDLGMGAPGRISALQSTMRRGNQSADRPLSATLEADRSTKRGRLRSPIDALYSTLADLGRTDH
jgi:DNA polymerase III delta subunit